MLQNIRIVLVETSHTGNMGSVARAMKTMGLTNLWLVNPLVKPDSQAIALAAGASDVIGNANIVDTLDEALAGCSLVVGTSARSRTLPWPMLDPRECGLKSVAEAAAFLRPSGADAAGNRVYPRQSSGPGDEQAAPFVYPRPPGKPGAEHPARYAGVN